MKIVFLYLSILGKLYYNSTMINYIVIISEL